MNLIGNIRKINKHYKFKNTKSSKQEIIGKFNGFKYVKISKLLYKNGTTDRWNIVQNTRDFFIKEGYYVINEVDYNKLDNKCEVLHVEITHTNIHPPNYGTNIVYFNHLRKHTITSSIAKIIGKNNCKRNISN